MLTDYEIGSAWLFGHTLARFRIQVSDELRLVFRLESHVYFPVCHRGQEGRREIRKTFERGH
jgi:hypothetical protein